MARTIDLTPTWSGMLPALLAIIEAGNDTGKTTARQELARMAKGADEAHRARESLKSWRMSREDVRRLKEGDVVRLTCSGSGGVDLGGREEERTYQPGALAHVGSIAQYAGQGLAVTVTVITGPGRYVDNVFDETDADAYPFAAVAPAVAALARAYHSAQLRDDEMSEKEVPPTGDDYNDVFSDLAGAARVLDRPHAVGPLSAVGLDARSIAAILAGLQLLHVHASAMWPDPAALAMASDAEGQPVKPLSADDIRALIDSL